MMRLEQLTSNHESRRGPAPDEVSWALAMLREAEQDWGCEMLWDTSEECIESNMDKKHWCVRCLWLAKLREEAK